MRRIVDGIAYLHSHNVIHRDISLSNILLTKDLKVKISDFGLATYTNTQKTHNTLCGTANYMSPEVIMKSEHSFPVDLWSLGSIFYTLLIGRPPFETNTVQSTLTQVVMGELFIPDSVTFEAKDLLRKLLCRDISKRIRIEEVLKHSFMLKHTATNFSVKKSSIFEGIAPAAVSLNVPPLNSIRLQPVRFETRNAILHILQNHEIVLEFLKSKHKSHKIVDEVCRISSDGLRIIIYKPNNGHGIMVKENPVDIPEKGADHIFSYQNIPLKFHKKYYYAARFVDMVKAKTPKIVFYSAEAKFQLMENLENFEMFFYDSWKILKSNSEAPKLFNDAEIEMTGSLLDNFFCGSKMQHAEECLKHCMEVEKSLRQVNSEFTVFPVIIGRRPNNSSHNKENTTMFNHISSSQTTFKSPMLKFSSFAN